MQGCPGNKRRAVKLFPLADKPLSTQALERVDPFGETKLASTNSTDRPMAFALHCALCFSKLCFVRAEEQKEQFPRLAASSANLADYNSAVKAIIEVIEKEPRICLPSSCASFNGHHEATTCNPCHFIDGCKGSALIILAFEGTLICRQLPIVKFMNKIKSVIVPYTTKHIKPITTIINKQGQESRWVGLSLLFNGLR